MILFKKKKKKKKKKRNAMGIMRHVYYIRARQRLLRRGEERENVMAYRHYRERDRQRGFGDRPEAEWGRE